MDVSIVIRARDEAEHLGDVLKAISRQDFAGSLEVIVVDSGSRDGTVDIARRLGCRVICIPPERFSWGFALNRGARESRGEFIVNLSAHAIPADPSWLRNLIQPFREGNSRLAAVYGRQLPLVDADPFEAVELDLWFPDWAEPRVSNSFSNANGALRRELWKQFPFDEEMMLHEDAFWAHSLARQGYHTIYQPKCRVYHNHELEVTSRRRTSGIFLRWYWRSYTSYTFIRGYRGASLRYALKIFRRYAALDYLYLQRAGRRAEILKIPIYELIRQYASWRGARDFRRNCVAHGKTWRQRYFAPRVPGFLRLLARFM